MITNSPKKSRQSDIHALGEYPKELVYEISKWIVYHFAVGKSDISGEDWGDIFAKGVTGNHLSSPVGLADVVLDEGPSGYCEACFEKCYP